MSLQDAVDDPVVAHQHHQAEEADHHVELHRAQHEDHVEGVAPRMPRLGDEVGQRVAQRQGHDRDDRRQPDRAYRRLVVERAVEEADVVLEREVPLDVDHARDRLVEGDEEQRDGRDDEEDQEEDESRQHQPVEPGVGENAPDVGQLGHVPRFSGGECHRSVRSVTPRHRCCASAPLPQPGKRHGGAVQVATTIIPRCTLDSKWRSAAANCFADKAPGRAFLSAAASAACRLPAKASVNCVVPIITRAISSGRRSASSQWPSFDHRILAACRWRVSHPNG